MGSIIAKPLKERIKTGFFSKKIKLKFKFSNLNSNLKNLNCLKGKNLKRK